MIRTDVQVGPGASRSWGQPPAIASKALKTSSRSKPSVSLASRSSGVRQVHVNKRKYQMPPMRSLGPNHCPQKIRSHTPYLYRGRYERVGSKFYADRSQKCSGNAPLQLDPRGTILHEHRNCGRREDNCSVDNHADRYLDHTEKEALDDDTTSVRVSASIS